jgi:hypothetical protein
MKAVFLLLVTVMIGFGYLLSEHLQAQDRLAELQQVNDQLRRDHQTLENQLAVERSSLAQKDQTIRELNQKNSAQEDTIRRLQQENASLKREVALLRMQSSLPDASSLLLFLPVIPASVAVTYLLVRSGRHARPKTTARAAPNSLRIALSDQEVQEIIRLRRNQK